MVYSEKLKDQSRKSEKDFTRKRKIGFIPLVCLIINMVRKSTQLELDEFRERFMPESAKSTTYTKQSFSEARQKLSPNAFKMLNDGFIEEFYKDDDYKTYRGFRLLAVDASLIDLPNTKELQAEYGFSSNQAEGYRLARSRSSHLVDLANRLAVHAVLGKYTDSERDMAKLNIDKLLELTPSHIPNLILFDRGYPSAALIQYLQSKGVHFLMRVSSAFYAEVANTQTEDELVRIVITKERAKELKKKGTPLPKGTVLGLRVLKIPLPSGDIETLITDLHADQLPYPDCKDLYFQRWGIETRFNELKHQFEIENFSGETPTVIEQDFHATILLSNMASLIEQDAQEEKQEEQRKANKPLKYDEYKINHNLLVGKMKNRFVEILLEEDDQKKEQMYRRLLEELKRNIVPVVKGRSFPRTPKMKPPKYTKSKRRSL